jgi:hypothetical protein
MEILLVYQMIGAAVFDPIGYDGDPCPFGDRDLSSVLTTIP